MAPEDNSPQTQTEDSTEQRSSRIPAWVWLGGGLLVLLSLVTGLQTRRLQTDLSELKGQLRKQRLRGLALDAERQRHEDVLAILTSTDTREFRLRHWARANISNVRLFWNEQKGALLVASRLLPVPPPDRTLQLWVIKKNGIIVNCGAFRPDADGRASLLVMPKITLREARALWITEEPEDGSAQPSSQPLWQARVR